jgi:glutamyl-tRNA synthetase
MSERKIRVRYAPSPTGPQHVGGVRTALFNYLFAKQNDGDFILRIEDTDQTRFVEGAEQYLLDSMDWAGIKFDEGPHIGGKFGPYRQSERKGIYENYVQQLLDNGWAYYAFDTPEELDTKRKEAEEEKRSFKYDVYSREDMKNSLSLPSEEVKRLLDSGDFVVRFKMPAEQNIILNDEVRGEVIINSSELDDKIIFKSDGLPTYHLANVVDDHLMEITHVIRGEEWLPSAPLHVMLYRALGWEDETPTFAHLPLLLKPTGKGKLSKRDGDAMGFPVFPLKWTDPSTGEVSNGYKESGYFPEAFLNILAFLGWNPGTEQELFTLNELVKAFSLKRIIKSGAKFDPEKAKWFNQQYLWKKNSVELVSDLKLLKPEYSDAFLSGVVEVMKERVQFVHDIVVEGDYFFDQPKEYDEKSVKKKWKDNSSKIVTELKSVFSGITDFHSSSLESAFKTFVEEKEIGFGIAMIGLRLCLTGKGGGPGLFDIMEILGKDESLKRLDTGVEQIEALKAAV